MRLFDQTYSSIEKALSYSTERNNVISNNIANVDTPNYKSKDVIFKNVLSEEIDHLSAKRTHPKHLPFSTLSNGYKTVINNNTMYSHNGNNVDVDKEMANLAKNQIYYRSMVDRLNGKFNTMQTVIRGGR
ncbi:flagellar basal body rod protein FlgB [Pseudogracilibacillus sp. SE30717A]|uniref:flagellar basal body rod protein FlgB n=1 Tax=Pseudogracilibacillus sp. SE30717A TaxID=3098293 RepID=UPI00300DFA19